MTVEELFQLSLGTTMREQDKFVAEAEGIMRTGEELVDAASSDSVRIQAAMAVSGGETVDEQRRRVGLVLTWLGIASDLKNGSNFAVRRRIFHALSPLPVPYAGIPSSEEIRAIIETLGLTELATAIHAFVYFRLRSDAEVGTFAWRQAHPGAVPSELGDTA